MNIAGIIAEYNPFHNGHMYHLQKTRELAGCDFIVAVMDGAFTQRGEPALTDKFARVECALRSGVDAVFELPAAWAARPAQIFARGGVEILNALHVDEISFGCETQDIEQLKTLADMLSDESDALSAAIRTGLDAGQTFARARGNALAQAAGVSEEFLRQPNTALALEYLQAMKRVSCAARPVAVLRTAPYHAEGEEWASASAVRRAVYEGRAEEAILHLPVCTRDVMARAIMDGVCRKDVYGELVLYRLRSMALADAEGLADGGEGLAGRLLEAAARCVSYDELVEQVKCKRYTRARITRLIAAAMLGIREDAAEEVPYLRILGFRKDARALLTELARRADRPMVSDAAKLRGSEAFETECRATDLWGQLVKKREWRVCGREFTQKMVVV